MEFRKTNGKKHLLALGIYASVAILGCKKDDSPNIDNNPSTNSTDQNFMQKASYGNNSEVDAAQLANTKASDAVVRGFATKMISDHSTAESDLQSLAAKKVISIPSTPDSAHVALKQQLQMMSGRAFDSMYMHQQRVDHDVTINLMQDEIANGKDGDVKSYASKYLPKIQAHKQMVDSIITVMHY